ncbi:MAG: CoA-binding protein [Planctomycetota bacterium]
MKAMNKNIKSIMNPKSIAVVGATNRPDSVGLAVFRNILTAGFHGVLYPVNPKAKYVQSVKAYPKLEDIPDRSRPKESQRGHCHNCRF